MRVMLRRGANKSQYGIDLQMNVEQATALLAAAQRGDKWHLYVTPFGEDRLVNIHRFDIIDFKPEKGDFKGKKDGQ